MSARLRFPVRGFATLALMAACAGVQAAEYQSIGKDPAVLYDAPTLRGTKIAALPRGMPVEIVVGQTDWVRIRDSGGALGWLERKMLVPKRTVVATDPVPVEVRSAADDGAPSVFRAAPGVLMDLAGAPSGGWVAVRHRDGSAGFVRVGSVWGE